MNKQHVLQKLQNSQLDAHERETLNQLLHYMNTEGVANSVDTTSSNSNSEGRIRDSSHNSNYKNKRRASSKDSSPSNNKRNTR